VKQHAYEVVRKLQKLMPLIDYCEQRHGSHGQVSCELTDRMPKLHLGLERDELFHHEYLEGWD
jgi:hypothetical protein